MHRYAEMIKGRLSMELSSFMAAGNKQITEMGESALCVAVTLMNRLDTLRRYSFLPHELVSNMIACLLPVGELMSALLNLSIQRIEAWFSGTLVLSPSKRGSRLVQFNQVLVDALEMIHFQAPEEFELYRDVLIKVLDLHELHHIQFYCNCIQSIKGLPQTKVVYASNCFFDTYLRWQ